MSRWKVKLEAKAHVSVEVEVDTPDSGDPDEDEDRAFSLAEELGAVNRPELNWLVDPDSLDRVEAVGRAKKI